MIDHVKGNAMRATWKHFCNDARMGSMMELAHRITYVIIPMNTFRGFFVGSATSLSQFEFFLIGFFFSLLLLPQS
jgi:hypothetical protein